MGLNHLQSTFDHPEKKLKQSVSFSTNAKCNTINCNLCFQL
jgi:hypothetical protein